MNDLIQTLVVAAVVSAAAVFAAVRIARSVRGKKPSCCGSEGGAPASGGCEGCSGCGCG